MDTLTYPIAMLVAGFILAGFRVANQYERGVVFRLGRLTGTRGPGLYWLIPLIEWQTRVDTRIVTAAVGGQETITTDNVPVKVDAVVWYRTVDPARAVVEVRDIPNAVVQVALTTLRTTIGKTSMDAVLKEQDVMSDLMRRTIDTVTEPWGVKVEMVEIRNVEIPASMQRVMAQEAEALRERRARVIKAEAEYEAAQRLRQAAEEIAATPAALELRRMQMITEVGAEQNTTTIIMLPSEIVAAAGAFARAAAPPA